jgi:hypothetical protein
LLRGEAGGGGCEREYESQCESDESNAHGILRNFFVSCVFRRAGLFGAVADAPAGH